MAIIPWKPFWDIDRFFDEEWLGPSFGEFKFPKIRAPRMDIYEEGNKIVAEVELPGIDPKDINVEVKNNFLKLEAKTEEKKEIKEKGYYRKEIGERYFQRTIPLPTDVVDEKAEAEYVDGILKITIPKATPKKEKEKKIKIKVKK